MLTSSRARSNQCQTGVARSCSRGSGRCAGSAADGGGGGRMQIRGRSRRTGGWTIRCGLREKRACTAWSGACHVTAQAARQEGEVEQGIDNTGASVGLVHFSSPPGRQHRSRQRYRHRLCAPWGAHPMIIPSPSFLPSWSCTHRRTVPQYACRSRAPSTEHHAWIE